MGAEMRGKSQSFADILEAFSMEKNEAPYQNGADLGLGLLNELYFAFKKYSRAPKTGPKSQERKEQKTAQEKVEAKPLKPWTSAEKAAISFFTSHGECEPASMTELKKSFRRLARRFHPDSKPNANDSERLALNVKFRQLRQFYLCLEGHFSEMENPKANKAAA